jgi:WD40 repeat protein
VRSLVLLSNGHLASASDDKSIRIWNLKSAERGENLVKTIFQQESRILFFTSLSLLLNGNLASGDWSGSIGIWNFEQNSTNYSSNHAKETMHIFNFMD